VRVVLGLPETLRPAAARLYWQAFGPKLGRLLGPEGRATAYLCDTLAADHALAALSEDGRLLGIAGFRSPAGAFTEGSPAALRARYGWLGALWRLAALRAFASDIDNDRFLVDGLCVAREARGQGVGTALIEAMAAEGRARGYAEMRLEVIDTNLRARALYERLGFRATGTARLGALRLLFGFDAAVTMVRPLR
jgi:ribosomal protein S18 acetylase RimI-like enzyme